MRPLDSLRVLDFSRLGPGPYASMLLADMGASVIRVDRLPLAADLPAFLGDVLGRGKRSIGVDLKHPSGVAVALALAKRSDVLLEGFRPGVMERLGLGPEETMAANPRLVYARLTGWGQQGPLAQRAGHDINYIAIAGVLGAIGHRGLPPVPPLNLLADFAGGGLSCAFGILCALRERDRSGLGQVIDAAMIDGAMNLMTVFAKTVHEGTWGELGTNVLDTGAHFYQTYETADGEFMAVGAMEPEFYAAFLAGLGIDDADLRQQMDPRSWPAMKDRIAKVFRTKTRDEWTKLFEPTDACVTPVLRPREAPGHPHNKSRGAFVEGDGGIPVPAVAPRLSRTPGAVGGGSPARGAHTASILAEVGYSPREIERLIGEGAVACAPAR